MSRAGNRILFTFPLPLVFLLLLSCGHKPHIEPRMPYWVDNDRVNIPEPESLDPHVLWMTVKRSSFDQAKQLLDMERNIRILFDNREQASNINSYDEVPNSTWFNNRHHLDPMTPAEVKAGVDQTPGPDTSGILYVFRPKSGGATPGFWIEDERGDQYIVKFDPFKNPEMATAASAMGSRYFHACGYNVSQETIFRFRPENLRIRDGATIKGADGDKREMTMEDIESILGKVHVSEDGSIRALASLSLGKEGKIIGPFSFNGKRDDDPNNWYAHESRRELRGLYVIASLVNHYDIKDQNTLDIYVEDHGSRYLKHYLIDFASTFGSDGNSAKPPIKGYANTFDVRDVMVSTVTLGLKFWPWEFAVPYRYPSVGYFESDLFEPDKFDCIYPNPAWEDMTRRDAYWGAKVVMSWRDEHLRALVETGDYSNPDAEEYVLDILKERRDEIGRHWFGLVNPLDYFSLQAEEGDRQTGETGLVIRFEDLAVKYGLEMNNAIYSAVIEYNGKSVLEIPEFREMKVRIPPGTVDSMIALFPPEPESYDDNLYKVDIRTRRINRDWSKPTRLWLWYEPLKQGFRLIGIEHLD